MYSKMDFVMFYRKFPMLFLVCVCCVCAEDIDIYKEQLECGKNQFVGSAIYVDQGNDLTDFNDDEKFFDTYFPMFGFSSNGFGYGNVKKFITLVGDGDSWLLDVPNKVLKDLGLPFESVIDGDISMLSHEALSFWTLQSYLPSLEDAVNSHPNYVLGRDGADIQLGGVGQNIPSYKISVVDYRNKLGGRQLYTNNHDATELLPLDWEDQKLQSLLSERWEALAIWPSLLSLSGFESSLLKRMLLHDVRGVNVFDSQYDFDAESGHSKSWMLGDVIHSSPFIIHYPIKKEDVRSYQQIIFGSNDGFIHWVENLNEYGEESGIEKYGFIPDEILEQWPQRFYQREYDNSGDNIKHQYGMDGEISSLSYASEDKYFMYLYAGMRRGGKSYYGFDVSKSDSPPLLLGRLNKSNALFSEMGYSFAEAVPAWVNYDGSVIPVLVIAGGYNEKKDDYIDYNNNDKSVGYYDNTHGSDVDDEGNVIYIVNAKSLELVWKVTNRSSLSVGNTHFYHSGLRNSIPSTVSVLDYDGDGLMDQIYVGDIGGNVWRGEFPSCSALQLCDDSNFRQKHWRLTQLATLGSSSAEGDIRFFYPPAVFFSKDSVGEYIGIVIASGDVENPLELTDKNKMYLLKDRRSFSNKIIEPSSLPDVSACIVQVSADCVKNAQFNGVVSYLYGWQLDLSLAGSGVKATDKPVVQNGLVYLTAYRPHSRDNSVCVSDEQGALLFLVDLLDGTAANDNKTRFVDIGLNQLSTLDVKNGQIYFPRPLPKDFIGINGAEMPANQQSVQFFSNFDSSWQLEFWLEGSDG